MTHESQQSQITFGQVSRDTESYCTWMHSYSCDIGRVASSARQRQRTGRRVVWPRLRYKRRHAFETAIRSDGCYATTRVVRVGAVCSRTKRSREKKSRYRRRLHISNNSSSNSILCVYSNIIHEQTDIYVSIVLPRPGEQCRSRARTTVENALSGNIVSDR